MIVISQGFALRAPSNDARRKKWKEKAVEDEDERRRARKSQANKQHKVSNLPVECRRALAQRSMLPLPSFSLSELDCHNS